MARNLMLGDAVLYQRADGVHAVGQGRVSDYWYAPGPALSPEEKARLINEQFKACKRDQQTNVADLSERQEVKPSDVLRAVLKRRGEKVEALENKLIEACLNCGRDGNAQHDSDNTCSSCSPWPAKYDWKSMPASMPISREVYVKDEATRLAEAQDLEQAMQEAGWVGRTLEPRVAAALTMEPQAFSRRVWSLQEE